MIKAVVFDMDGTLIDTEKYYGRCWGEAARHFGYEMKREHELGLRSLGRPFGEEYLKKALKDPDLSYMEIKKYRQMLVEKCIREEGVNLKKGAKKLLDYLKSRNIIRAIATASDEERVRRYLPMAGLDVDEYFDRVVTAYMVNEGKPSPDIYIYAAKCLNTEPSEMMAVEDSPNGILSASRAGYKAVFVPDQDRLEEKYRKYVFAEAETLEDIIPLIEND